MVITYVQEKNWTLLRSVHRNCYNRYHVQARSLIMTSIPSFSRSILLSQVVTLLSVRMVILHRISYNMTQYGTVQGSNSPPSYRRLLDGVRIKKNTIDLSKDVREEIQFKSLNTQLAPGIVDKNLEDLICFLSSLLLHRILLICYRNLIAKSSL